MPNCMGFIYIYTHLNKHIHTYSYIDPHTVCVHTYCAFKHTFHYTPTYS